MFPVAKLVVLYACVSYREGSRGRPYVFNVDHSVKRCNINVITLLPTNHQLDHFCFVIVIRISPSACGEKLLEEARKETTKEATETSQYIQKVFLSFTYKNHQAVLHTLLILPKANFIVYVYESNGYYRYCAHLGKNSCEFLGAAVCIYE